VLQKHHRVSSHLKERLEVEVREEEEMNPESSNHLVKTINLKQDLHVESNRSPEVQLLVPVNI
jgi:hypothetical protein